MGQERFPALLFFGVFDTRNGQVLRETSGLGEHVCLGLESIPGFDSFLAAESCGASGSDRLRGGAYILSEGQSLFVRYAFLPVIIQLQSKKNVDKGDLLHKVNYSDANRHMLHKLDRQAISLYFVRAFGQSELSKTWLEIKTGMEEWLSSW